MNKKKRILVSTIVFLSVFSLSTIFYIPFHELPKESREAKEKEAFSGSVDATRVADTGSVESFSYSKDFPPHIVQEEPSVTPVSTKQPVTESPTTDMGQETLAAEAKEAPLVEEPTAKESTKQESSLYANIGISVANDFVNIRKEASTDSEILGKLYQGSAAEILKTKDDWYYVESGSVKGYVKSEFLKTNISDEELIEKYGERSIQVDTDGLNVREEKDKTSDKLDVIYRGEVYPVLEVEDEWVKINIPDDKITGYVLQEYVEMIVKFKKAVSKEEEAELLQLESEEKAKEATAVRQQGGVDYSNNDLKLLACLVHAEAGSQSYEGKLAVANIVLNRMKSSKYPDSIKEVIYQSGQFSVARSGSLEKHLNNYENYNSWSQKLSVKAAKAALSGSNNIGSRLHFNSYKAAVRKGYHKRENAVKIDDQLFW
jgi:uncharacterized protein YgiM (DUF1202 family)